MFVIRALSRVIVLRRNVTVIKKINYKIFFFF